MHLAIDVSSAVRRHGDRAVVHDAVGGLGKARDDGDAGFSNDGLQALDVLAVGGFRRRSNGLPCPVAGKRQLGRQQARRSGADGFNSRGLDGTKVRFDIAGNRFHLKQGKAEGFVFRGQSFELQAPSSFGRSPNRAIRPKINAATATNRMLTAAMVGV